MKTPGVYVEETTFRPRPIEAATTAVTGFIGTAARGPTRDARRVRSWSEYERAFGGIEGGEMGFAVRSFFDNGGSDARIVRIGKRASRTRWLSAFTATAGCNLLLLPGLRALGGSARDEIAAAAARHCLEHRMFLIVDPPASAAGVGEARAWAAGLVPTLGAAARNVATYWPDLIVENAGAPRRTGAGGAAAGVYARIDGKRGVWKAAAGTEANLRNVSDIAAPAGDADGDQLMAASINPIRRDRGSIILWGARTLAAQDPEWKYVPIRRLAIFLEESLCRGLEWVVFEPNSERLWASARRSAEDFLHGLWRQGAFAGARPQDSFYVRCDRSTMTQGDIDQGRLVAEIGVAPLKPAEFVVIRIRLFTGSSEPGDDD